MKKKHHLNSGNTKSIRRLIPHDYVSSLKTIASQPIGSCIATAPVKLRADLRFEWSPLPRVPKSFSQLKQRLTEAPILCLSISFSQFLVLETDASIQRLGAILSQNQTYSDSYTIGKN